MKRESFALAVVCLLFVLVSFPVQAQVSFLTPPTYKGSGNVFVADFNGDGKPDILVSDGTMNLGNGDGTFTPGTSLSTSSVPVLAVADFNGDGKPDVLEQGTGTLLVLLGNGDGTFQAPISTASGASLSAVAATDLNGDGKADVVGVFNGSLMVYISNGDGTFKSSPPYNIGVSPTLLSLGDFNGDSKTDVALSVSGNGVAGTEIVFLGNGDGTFQATPKTSAGLYSILDDYENAVVGDFNGDGKLDLVVSGCNALNCSPSSVNIFLGNGDGTFQAPVAAISIASLGAPLAAVDLNGDGKLDLVVGGAVAEIWLGNGDGTFSNVASYLTSSTGFSGSGVVAVADFNGDGKADVAVQNNVLLGNGNATFQGINTVSLGGSANAIVVGDFEKSGTPDVAAVSYLGGSSPSNLYIVHNNGNVLSVSHTYTFPQSGDAIVTADFNGDGNLDLLVVGTAAPGGDWGYTVLLGNGDGSFQAPVFYPQNTVGSGYPSIVVADFNSDGKLDFAVTTGNDTLAVLLGNGDGTFGAPFYVYDDSAQTLLVADFNGDGKLDIAAGVANTGTSGTALLFGNGDGTFQAAVFPSSLNDFSAQFTADLNNDGNPDLVASFNGVALGNGDGTFTVLPDLSGNQVMGIADLNGDGKPDALVTYFGTSVHPLENGVLPGKGDGTFGQLISIPGNPLLYNPGVTTVIALIADMNDDGRPDVVFSLGEQVAVLPNTTPSGFALSATAMSPSPLTAGSSAASTVTVWSMFGFQGAVALSCGITPLVTPAPTCSLSSSSVQISGSGTQSVTVKVGTTAPVTSRTVPPVSFPTGPLPLIWTLTLLGSGWLLMRSRGRLPALAVPIVLLAFVFSVGCGGSSSSSTHTTPGTPTGNYTVTITATSGSVSQTMALTMVVQ